MAMKTRRLADKAERDCQAIQLGLAPSDNELPPHFIPDLE